MTNVVEFVQIEPRLEQIYMGHGAKNVFTYMLTQISIPVASEDPIKWLDRLEDLIEIDPIVVEGVKLSGLKNSPVLVQGLRKQYYKALSFIMLYRGDMDGAKEFFGMAYGSEFVPEHLQAVLGVFDEIQRVLSESKPDLNKLRQEYGFESLDLFLLEHFDKYTKRFKAGN